jgi:hypothetical protein
MGTDVAIFANHKIGFSNSDKNITANNIKTLLDNLTIKNLSEIKSSIRSYYDWQGYDDEIRNEWHEKIDNWKGNDWDYYIDDNWEDCTKINFYGPYNFIISFTNNNIQFNDPGYRYSTFFGMDKKHRIEWRKYYYQVISLFGGDFALYLPDQGDVAAEFTEKIWDYDLDLNSVKKDLIEKYGENKFGIDDFPTDEDDFVELPYYFIDYFEDIK